MGFGRDVGIAGRSICSDAVIEEVGVGVGGGAGYARDVGKCI